MSFEIDLKSAYAIKDLGELRLVFTWYKIEQTGEPQRVMCMVAHRQRGNPTYIVTESSLWKSCDAKEEEKYAKMACLTLGMKPNALNAAKINSIIHGHTEFIIRMPPAPEPEQSKASYGTTKVQVNGETVDEFDLKINKEFAHYV